MSPSTPARPLRSAPRPAPRTPHGFDRSAPVAGAGGGASGYHLARKIAVGGDGGWDYALVDGDRLYTSHATKLVVLDIANEKVIGEVPNTNGIHGVALAPALGRGFTSNGRDTTVTIFDIQTLATLGTIKVTGANPDAIHFDAATQRVFTFNGRGENATAIDAKTGKVLATIPLPGKPEFAQSDGKGLLYVNIETDTGQIVVIDTKALKEVKRYWLPGCEEPSGLALDRAHTRLFSVCGNSQMAVSDPTTGKVVTLVPIGPGVDAAAYDAETKLVFASNGGDGTLSVIRQDSPDHYTAGRERPHAARLAHDGARPQDAPGLPRGCRIRSGTGPHHARWSPRPPPHDPRLVRDPGRGAEVAGRAIDGANHPRVRRARQHHRARLHAGPRARGARARVVCIGAQARPVTRSEVIAAALDRAPRAALARADSAAAGAEVVAARQYENPALTLEHTRSTPRQHVSLELPTWIPAQRSLRIRSADAALVAATLRARFDIEGARYDADTAYTHALVAQERARLSTRSAVDADSLVTLARLRRDAGDGSELDVQLAELSAGQFANGAAIDSLGATSALYSVQSTMGLSSATIEIALADSLDAGSLDVADSSGTPLLIAAAQSDVHAAELAVSLERGRLFSPPSLTVGFERQEPGGTENQVLPMIGLSLPLPLFNRNRGGVLVAQAQLDRSTAMLRVAEVETNAALALAEREQAIALVRLARMQSLVSGAERVAALSLLAFREGAAALPSVLEAQRSSRDTRTQYVEAVGAVRDAVSRLRLLRLTINRPGR